MSKSKIKSSYRREERKCPICNLPRSYSNFAAHIRACREREKNKSNELILLKESIQNLQQTIKDLQSKNSELQSLLNNHGLEPYTFENLLCNKSFGTRNTYKTIWFRYLKWCKDKNIEPKSITSATSYFDNIKETSKGKTFKSSTVNLIRSVMIVCFNRIYSINLSKYFPRKIKFNRLQIKPKYVMTDLEIKSFLLEQIHDLNNFLSFYLLIFSGCRVHSLAMLSYKSYSDGVFKIVDFKTDKSSKFVLTKNMKAVMDHYLQSNSSSNYLFFSQDLNINSEKLVTIRGKYLSMKIRKIMLKSKVFENIDTKTTTISPHIFRTTKVQQVMGEIKQKTLEKCRKAIGHSPGTQSINYYLPKDFTISLYSSIMEEIDSMIQDELTWMIKQ